MDEVIRRVVREEISRAIRTLGETARRFPDYDTTRIEDTVAYVVQRICADAEFKIFNG